MGYPQDQIDELKTYCSKVSLLHEAGVDFLYLHALRLPPGCTPTQCDALLCPVSRDNYPSRLYLSEKIACRYDRNWNTNARIGEKNWFAFSWKIEPTPPTLAAILVAHLTGFAREK